MRSHFIPASPGTKSVRSSLVSGAAVACAVTGATALMPSTGSAQVAFDSAANPIYNSGWSAGQNGGTGFGAWSFNGTSGGGGQTMSSAGAIGTAWTMYTTTTGGGISDVGRSITGGLGVGETFQTVLQNPTSYHYFGGFDILFLNGTDNNAGGDNTSAIRVQDFHSGYFNPGDLWSVQDSNGSQNTTLSAANTGAAGVQLDLYLTSATTYSLTMTALNGSGTSTIFGNYSGPINYVNFREYDGVGSGGPNDVANNFGISYVQVIPEPSSIALAGLGFGGLLFLRRKK